QDKPFWSPPIYPV
uniref:Tryptophyllin-T3-1 n=1 Tax=Phasmahyla jandaia TaxID=762504 RepID=TY31_PHAJA|nr:RecName: Full=Tryptophyllin-T3-1; Short=Pj-T3-1 [Phasmahyla jandaia]